MGSKWRYSIDINYVDPSVRIEQVKDVIFKNINTLKSYIDSYISDLLALILEELELIQREIHVIFICVILFWPVHKNEPVPTRSDIMSKSKLIAKGMLSERKTFLGWIIDSRRMRI